MTRLELDGDLGGIIGRPWLDLDGLRRKTFGPHDYEGSLAIRHHVVDYKPARGAGRVSRRLRRAPPAVGHRRTDNRFAVLIGDESLNGAAHRPALKSTPTSPSLGTVTVFGLFEVGRSAGIYFQRFAERHGIEAKASLVIGLYPINPVVQVGFASDPYGKSGQ